MLLLGLGASTSPSASFGSNEPENVGSTPSQHNVSESGAESLRDNFQSFLAEYLSIFESSSQQGETVDVLSPTASVVETSGGRPAIVQSTLPVVGANEEPLDLELVAVDGGMSPKNPATPVVFPETLSESIALSDTGATLSVPQADGLGEPFALVDESGSTSTRAVLYEDAFTDTDLLLAPLPGGMEIFAQIRSESAADLVPLQLDLPAGATLADRGEIVEIVDGDRSVGSITAPFAVDANGDDVPVDLTVEGNTVSFGIAGDLEWSQYPVLVDPVVEWWNWHNGSHTNFEGWVSSQSGSTQYEMTTYCNSAITNSCNSSGTGLGRGLYVNARPSRTFAANSQGRWNYTVPGTDAYISLADVFSWRYQKGSHAATHPFGFFGLSTGTAWTSLYWTDVSGGGSTTLTGGTTSKVFSTGLSSHSNISIPTGNANWRFMRVAGVTLTIEDQSAPVFYTLSTAALPPSTAWSTSTAIVPLPYSGWDNGVGISQAMLTAPKRNGGVLELDNDYVCDGTAALPCPSTINALTHPGNDRIMLDLAQVEDGVSTISMALGDALGKTSATKTAVVKLDREGPSLYLSGSLYKRRNRTIGTAPHQIQIDANDGSSGEPRSGVKAIRVQIDGAADPTPLTQTCPAGSCELSRTFTLNPSTLTPGTHTVRIEAEDQVGNISSRLFEVTVDSTDPCADMETEAETECEAENGDIYLVSVWSGGLSSGGELRALEFVQPSTMSARSVDGTTNAVHTRGLVPCGGSDCAQVRHSTPSETSGAYTWEVITGDGPSDPQLETASLTLRPLVENLGTFVGTQPTRNVLKGWQTPPPGVAANVQVYANLTGDPLEDGHIGSFWIIDPNSGLPIRQTRVDEFGRGVEYRSDHFTYSPTLFKPNELNSDVFLQPPPTPIETSEGYTDEDWSNPEDPTIYDGL